MTFVTIFHDFRHFCAFLTRVLQANSSRFWIA